MRTAVLLAGCLAIATAAGAQVHELSVRFDRIDRDARKMIEAFQCAQATGRLRVSGAFGHSDSLGNRGLCVKLDGRLYSIMMSMDSALSRATRFNVVDMSSRQLSRVAIDTNAMLVMLRAHDAGIERGYARYEKANRPFVPIAFRTDGDSIAVWLVPSVGRPVLGGMQGYLFSPDGRVLANEINDFDSLRPFVIPDTGVVVIQIKDSLPTMSDMIAANAVNQVGRAVSIDAKTRVSNLVGQGSRAVWVHNKKP